MTSSSTQAFLIVYLLETQKHIAVNFQLRYWRNRCEGKNMHDKFIYQVQYMCSVSKLTGE